MKNLIKKIKEKKELSDLPDALIKEAISENLRKMSLASIPQKEKELKILVKEVRADLRKYTGRFQSSQKKKEKLLQSGQINELLKTHSSTKERMKIYPVLISIIKELSPKSILDLGCGLNPIAIAKEFPKTSYHAWDIKKSELDLISQFFKQNSIKGKTKHTDIKKIKKFPKTELTLLFKVLDIIETKGHKHAHNIMKNTPSKNIIASFSTRTLSGKPMQNARRFWFESILSSLNYTYKTRLFDNEVFYIIAKS